MDALKMAIVAYLMQAIADSDLPRSAPVSTLPNDVDAFEFTVLGDESMDGGHFTVRVTREE